MEKWKKFRDALLIFFISGRAGTREAERSMIEMDELAKNFTAIFLLIALAFSLSVLIWSIIAAGYLHHHHVL